MLDPAKTNKCCGLGGRQTRSEIFQVSKPEVENSVCSPIGFKFDWGDSIGMCEQIISSIDDEHRKVTAFA